MYLLSDWSDEFSNGLNAISIFAESAELKKRIEDRG